MHNRWLGPLALISGFLISAVSAYFSIYGLAKIFTDSMMAGVVVFGSLEIGKLVSASWVFRNWRIAPLLLKSFMCLAVVVMMSITSLGIFGYLSKSYTDKVSPVATVQVQQNATEQELALERDNLKRDQDTLAQMNKAVDSLSVERSVTVRRQQAKERQEIMSDIKATNEKIVALEKQKATAINTTQQASSDLGPLTFMAKTIFDDSVNSVDRAVRYLISLLVMVFDPLAIALLLAANFSFAQNESRPKFDDEPDYPLPVNKTELTDYLKDHGKPQTLIEEIPEHLGEVDEVYDREVGNNTGMDT